MSRTEQVKQKLHEFSRNAKIALGQNFLISDFVIQSIIKAVKNIDSQEIIEIGPGLGALTQDLLQLNKKITLIEFDRQFAEYWRAQAQSSPKTIIVEETDALKWDWQSHDLSSAVIVSNLPYQIGSRLVVDLSTQAPSLKNMILMFQLEVAERFLAQPRTSDYGLLSVIAQSTWTIKKVVDAGPQDFYPPPKINSRVLSFERKKADLTKEFVHFVKKAFQQRRKYMLKSFSAEKEVLVKTLKTFGYTERVRAEEISVEHYNQLFEVIKSSPLSE